MLQLAKSYEFSTLKLKLILIYLLNFLDLAFTLLLLQTGYMMEANPIMASVLHDPLLTISLKLLLPACLFFYMVIRLQCATLSRLKLSNYFIMGLMLFYSFINLLHLIWFLLLSYLSLIYSI